MSRASQSLEQIHSHTPNIFLSHTQISIKCNNLCKERNLLQLDLLHKAKKVGKLNNVIALHKKFMVLLSQNNVLRVKELAHVALQHKCSISYIVAKVLDAIDGIYRARPSDEDKDIAFIVLKLGGPSLLDILCKTNKLPSCSTAYRIAKEFKSFICPVTMSAGECVEKNLDVPYFLNSYTSSLKIDETYLTPKLRYNAKSSDIQSVCYQHASSHCIQFNTFSDLELVSEAIRNDECHVPKECLVAGISRLDCKSKFNVFLAWPSCSKEDYDGTYKIVSTASQAYKSLNGISLMNICTDGDCKTTCNVQLL